MNDLYFKLTDEMFIEQGKLKGGRFITEILFRTMDDPFKALSKIVSEYNAVRRRQAKKTPGSGTELELRGECETLKKYIRLIAEKVGPLRVSRNYFYQDGYNWDEYVIEQRDEDDDELKNARG